MKDHNELTPLEQKAFNQLSRSKTPPYTLESNIINILKIKGLINSTSSIKSAIKVAIGLAAIVLLFFVGFLFGRITTPTLAEASNPLYMLLLHEQAGSIPANDPAIVMEYIQWMQAIQSDNKYISGSELQPLVQFVGDQDFGHEKDLISGYFVVEAKDFNQAISISQTCPHIKYGGWIEVREMIES